MVSKGRDVNLVFLGLSSTGKSRLCNFMLERDTFEAKHCVHIVTRGIQSRWIFKEFPNAVINFQFIDTQGLDDSSNYNATTMNIITQELKKKLKGNEVHYFLILLKPEHMSRTARDLLKLIINTYKLDEEERKKNVCVIVTHCEWYNDNKIVQTIQEFQVDETVKRLLLPPDNDIRPKNLFIFDLPQREECVDQQVFDTCMSLMEQKRTELFEYLARDIQPIVLQPWWWWWWLIF